MFVRSSREKLLGAMLHSTRRLVRLEPPSVSVAPLFSWTGVAQGSSEAHVQHQALDRDSPATSACATTVGTKWQTGFTFLLQAWNVSLLYLPDPSPGSKA